MWCPGCGHGMALRALLWAVHELAIEKDRLAVVSGIGCAGRLGAYIDANTFHVTHGRPLAFATGLVVAVAGRVGRTAMGAGLVPVAVGYLVAHYLTYLLTEGQRIVVALSDPLQQGWDLLGTSEPASQTLRYVCSASAASALALTSVVTAKPSATTSCVGCRANVWMVARAFVSASWAWRRSYRGPRTSMPSRSAS